MHQKRFSTLLVVLIMALSTSAQHARRGQTNFRTLEGTVVDVAGVSRWAGIIVESGGREYMVQLHNFDDVGMVAIFEMSSDGGWRWSDWYFYHSEYAQQLVDHRAPVARPVTVCR